MRSLPSACRRRVVSMLGQALPPPINVARNSHAISSNVESTSLELQRFRVILKSDRGKLRATFVWRLSGRRPRVPWLGSCLEARPYSPTLRPLRLGVSRAGDGGFAALEASLRRVAGVSSQCSARPCRRPSMSHVIPMRLVQMLNPHRWNCNVFG